MRQLFTEYSTYVVAGLVGALVLMRAVLAVSPPGAVAARLVMWLWHPEARGAGREPETLAAVRATVSQNMDGTLLALAVVFGVLRPLVVQAFYIPSASMEPTLHGNLREQDRVLVNKYVYRLREPRRGDIVVFTAPEAALRGSTDGGTEYIKRLIGEPGDTVQVIDHRVWINGRSLSEPYLRDTTFSPFGAANADWGPATVPPGMVLMLGDNRDNSSDGRVWGFLPRENIIGKATAVFWPPRAVKLLDDRCRPLGEVVADLRTQRVLWALAPLLLALLAWGETAGWTKPARALVALTAAALVPLALVRPVAVLDDGVAPTYSRGDTVATARYLARLRAPRRGDVVVIADPMSGQPVARRIVGLPDEEVDIRAGEVYVDGRLIDSGRTANGGWWGPDRVPEGHLFVMTDQPRSGADSRAFGYVAAEEVWGTVLGRLWPPAPARGLAPPAAASE